MEQQFNWFLYWWLVGLLAWGAANAVFLFVAPALFVSIQKRLATRFGFPMEPFESFLKKVPLRPFAAAYLIVSGSVLYFLLTAGPETFIHR